MHQIYNYCNHISYYIKFTVAVVSGLDKIRSARPDSLCCTKCNRSPKTSVMIIKKRLTKICPLRYPQSSPFSPSAERSTDNLAVKENEQFKLNKNGV